jgi:hypothetical protein
MWTVEAMDGGDGRRRGHTRARRAVRAIAKVRQSIAKAEVGGDWQMDGGAAKEQILLEAGEVVG